MPPVKNLYVERRLTEVAIQYQNGDFVADQVSPILLVPQKSGKILEEDKTILQSDLNGDDAIAQGEEPGVIKVEITDRLYGTIERARGATVHDDEIDADRGEDLVYEPKIRAAELATQRLKMNREVRLAAMFRTAANWAAGHTHTPATKWDAATGSDPVADATTAKMTVKKDLQVVPNTALIPWEVVAFLANNSKVISLTSGGSTVGNAAIDQSPAAMIALMQRIFGVQNIVIPSAGNLGGGLKAAFNSTLPASAGGIWGDDVWIGYVPPKVGRGVPGASLTYRWKNAFNGQAGNAQGLVVTEEYRQRARTTFIDARTYSDERLLLTEAGYLITNVLNAF